jgi:hypothetical protein
MKVSQCVHYWLEYHKLYSKKTPSKLTSGSIKANQSTKCIWYSQLTSFFNFVTLNLAPNKAQIIYGGRMPLQTLVGN